MRQEMKSATVLDMNILTTSKNIEEKILGPYPVTSDKGCVDSL